MMKLTPAQNEQRLHLLMALRREEKDIDNLLTTLSNVLEDHCIALESMSSRYNQRLQELETLRRTVHNAQTEHFERMSQEWRESAEGVAYWTWALDWACPISGYNLVLPDPVREPEFTASEDLLNLPGAPSPLAASSFVSVESALSAPSPI